MKKISILKNWAYASVAVIGLLFSANQTDAMVHPERGSCNIHVAQEVDAAYGRLVNVLQDRLKKLFPRWMDEKDARNQHPTNWLQFKRVRYPEHAHITLRGTSQITKDAFVKVKGILDNFVPSLAASQSIAITPLSVKTVVFKENKGFPNGWFKKYDPTKSRIIILLEVQPSQTLQNLVNEINGNLKHLADALSYPGVSKDIYDRTGQLKIQNPQAGMISSSGEFTPHITVAIFSNLDQRDVDQISRLHDWLNIELKKLQKSNPELFKPLSITGFSLTKFREPGEYRYPLPRVSSKPTAMPAALKPVVVAASAAAAAPRERVFPQVTPVKSSEAPRIEDLSAQMKRLTLDQVTVNIHPITSTNDYLNNDYVAPFTYEGKTYKSVNDAYRVLKRGANDFWVMERLIFVKFLQNPELIRRLNMLPDHIKIINNSLHPYWGMGPDCRGQNWLGLIIQEMRYNAYMNFFREKYADGPLDSYYNPPGRDYYDRYNG